MMFLGCGDRLCVPALDHRLGSCGKRAEKRDEAAAATIAPTMTRERSVSDAEEMIGWLRGQSGKREVFMPAHSAGGCAGLEIARRHFDWLYAYIGVD